MPLLPHTLLLPAQTLAKSGAIHDLFPLAVTHFGPRGMIVHGRSLHGSGTLDALLQHTSPACTCTTWEHIGGEPTVQQVDALRAALRVQQPHWVAAIGGGSVIDLAKAAAGLASATEPTAYYQRTPSAIPIATLPVIAAPTTAGTGSEATVVSVLTDPEAGLKQSIRHASHMPSMVILDPDLLCGAPPEIVAAAGLDAFIQAFESLTSRFATPWTRTLAEFALVQISQNLLPLYRGDRAAAPAMLEASYITGMAFSHSRLGIIHGLAHPLGVRFHAQHGVTCACCLRACLAFNKDALADDLHRLQATYALNVEEQVSTWLTAMSLTNPFQGGTIHDMEAFIAETLASGSTAANPRPVTAKDVAELVHQITCT